MEILFYGFLVYLAIIGLLMQFQRKATPSV